MKQIIKDKLKSYEFWVSVASAVMMLLQTISIKIDVPYINEVTMAFLSLLTVSGILKKSGNKTPVSTEQQVEISVQPEEKTITDGETQQNKQEVNLADTVEDSGQESENTDNNDK